MNKQTLISLLGAGLIALSSQVALAYPSATTAPALAATKPTVNNAATGQTEPMSATLARVSALNYIPLAVSKQRNGTETVAFLDKTGGRHVAAYDPTKMAFLDLPSTLPKFNINDAAAKAESKGLTVTQIFTESKGYHLDVETTSGQHQQFFFNKTTGAFVEIDRPQPNK